MNAIVKALVETGFTGYFRPDHGRMIWGETGKPGYGLFDRAWKRLLEQIIISVKNIRCTLWIVWAAETALEAD